MGNGKGKFAKSSLLKLTNESDFEAACSGWELEDIIKQEDLESNQENRCSLCNQPHNDSFLIRYIKNNNKANVGSSCIKKFIKFNDISSQQDSNRFFEKKHKEILGLKSLKELFYEIHDNQISAEVIRKFRKACGKIMEVDLFGGTYKTEKWFKLLDNLNAILPQKLAPNLEERVRLVLYDPHKLNVYERKKAERGIKEEKKAKARVVTTHSKSSIYQDPSKFFDKNEEVGE